MVLRKPDDEQLVVELIGPEPGYPIMAHRAVEHIECGRLRLLEGIVDGFQAYPPAKARRGMIGAIARSIDGRVAGTAVFVHHDAVVASQPRLTCELRRRDGTDPDH